MSIANLLVSLKILLLCLWPDIRMRLRQTFAIFRTYSAFSPAAPMDHKNIGTRMAPTTFCGYNLSRCNIFCKSFQKTSHFVLTLIFWFCFVQLPRVGPIDIALWRKVHWKHPNLHKLISLSQTDFHWEMQKCLARKLWIAELENFHLSVKTHNITLGQIEQCRQDGSRHTSLKTIFKNNFMKKGFYLQC